MLDGLKGPLAALSHPDEQTDQAELRAAVVLRYSAGLSEAEIAARLNRPLGTVKWQLHAARRRLRRLPEGVLTGLSPGQAQLVGGDAGDPPAS